MPLTLSAITRYPVKSCQGDDLTSAVVEPWGLAGDRRWMLVDDDGSTVTARVCPQLVLVRPVLRADGGVVLTYPDLPDLTVDVPVGTSAVPVAVFKHHLTGVPAADEAHAWFSAVTGRSVRLVHLSDPTQRHANPRFARPDDVVSFADGYPMLVATTASLAALNELIAAGPHAAEGPLPMTRFRPNLVVDGGTAWAEDGWRRVRIGEAEFRSVKGCARCVLTLVDPVTARRGKEPIATLARHRRFDGATWFAMNLIPDTPGATVSVGDEVEVLESVPATDGPPR